MATIAEKKNNLAKLYRELEEGQKKMSEGMLSQTEGDAYEAKAKEAEALQKEVDQFEYVSNRSRRGREVPDPAIPDTKVEKEGMKEAKSRVAGFMPIGEYIALSPEYNRWAQQEGLPGNVKFSLPNLLKVKGYGGFLQKGFVPLSVEQKQGVEQHMMERKDLPVLGTGVIAPDRLSDIVRDTENDVLTIRDVIPVSPTSSNLIEWLARVSYTRGAEIQSEGPTASTQAVKGEADAEYVLRDAPVRTIAVTIPVTEQQLQDAPALVNMIREDLLWDLGKEEEEEIVWGDDTGVHLDGLEKNIAEAANTGGYTSKIDIIRTMITEIRQSGYQPTFTLLDPLDWEEIELMKGSDGHYIWAIIRDTLGPRIWGTRVVETVAMEEPGGTDRLIIVGSRVGATIFDRMQSQITMGWINDDFNRNIRRIKAEERIAFAVRRADAFRKYTITA
jgi:HK97 family phage major capsid protein